MKNIGIDLSGPSNAADTHCVVFEEQSGAIHLIDCMSGATDQNIVAILKTLDPSESVAIGLDAPLSYNPGGGDRPSDKDLRQAVVKVGLHPGSVMTPTMTKMAYLTLRGMGVARLIADVAASTVQVVEVHPGGAMALGGASLQAVKAIKTDKYARQVVLEWLVGKGLKRVVRRNPSDHYVAACACALAAWRWSQGLSVWCWPACVPHHPYDFAC